MREPSPRRNECRAAFSSAQFMMSSSEPTAQGGYNSLLREARTAAGHCPDLFWPPSTKPLKGSQAVTISPVLGPNTPEAQDSLESLYVTGPGQSARLIREGTQSQVREAQATAFTRDDGFNPMQGLDPTSPRHLGSYCLLHH